MRIIDLALRNFRSHVKTDVDGFATYNVITGHNASGKSTLLDAICMALTGTCRGFSSGRALEELRYSKARTRWGIRMNILVGRESGEGNALNIQRVEGQGPRSDVQIALNQETGINSAAVRCCLYMSGLQELAPKDAQRMLLSVAGPAEQIKVSDDVCEALDWISSASVELDGMTLGDAEGIYKQAYDQRRELGRVLKGAGVKPVPPADFKTELDGLGLVEVVDINTRLTKLLTGKRKQREELMEQKVKLETAPAALADRIKRGEARLVVLEKAKEECEPEAIGKATKAVMRDLSRAQETNRVIEAKAVTWNRERGGLGGAIDQVKRQIKNMEEIGIRGDCLTCGRKLTKAAATKAIASLKKTLGGYEGQLLEVDQAVLKLEPTIDTSSLDKQLRTIQMQEERYATVVADLDKVQAALKKLKNRKVTTANTDKLAEQIAKLDRSILAGEERSELVTKYAGALAHYNQTDAQQDKAKTELEKAELLVDQFGPKGAVRAQLAAGVGPFAKTLGELMAGMGFDVDLTPLLELAKDPDPLVNGRPARLLSDSEQLRFGVALACALATYTGFGIVGVDGWEILQGQTKVEVANLLNESGHQVFVFGTLTQMSREQWLSKISEKYEGWAGYFTEIENGETAVLSGKVEV